MEKTKEISIGEPVAISSKKDHFKKTTAAIHADRNIEKEPDIAPPLHLSTTYFADNTEGVVYSRVDTQTRRRTEKVLGELEGGDAILYSSGVAAVLAALYVFKPKKIAIEGGYHMTHSVIKLYKDDIDKYSDGESGHTIEILKLYSTDLWDKIGKGDVIYLESPKNPTCEMDDIKDYAEKAHKVGAYVIVDSTFATPVLQTPLEFGVDIVLHSCTKFLGGHSDLLGGALITKHQGIRDHLWRQRMVLGSVLGNLETYLLLRSLRSVHVRVKKQSKNATKIALWLAEQKQVTKVWHPIIPSHPSHELCKRQMKGQPACFSFELESEKMAQNLPKKLKLFAEATSLGGVESLIEWRYRHDQHAPPTLLRMSIGLESAKDLIEDLKQGIELIQ